MIIEILVPQIARPGITQFNLRREAAARAAAAVGRAIGRPEKEIQQWLDILPKSN